MRSHYRPQQDCAPQIHMQPSLLFPLAHNDWAGRRNTESLYCQLRTIPQQPPQTKQLTPTQKICELQLPTHWGMHWQSPLSPRPAPSQQPLPFFWAQYWIACSSQTAFLPISLTPTASAAASGSDCFSVLAAHHSQPALQLLVFPQCCQHPPTHTCSVSEMLLRLLRHN